VIHAASPDAVCPGLLQKPLDAAITRLNDDAKCTHFASHLDDHRNAVEQYRVHCLIEEVHGFHKSH